MKKYHVLLSTLGRSHYLTAAEYLVRRGVDLTVLQGWMPRSDSFLLKIIAKIIRRKSFVVGMHKRIVPILNRRTISLPLGEFVQVGLFRTVGRINDASHHVAARIGFWTHGFCTRKYLKGYDIFHVKSGLGRGGAIAKAHKLGMKVLVDHCVPHPLSMKKTTDEKGYDEWWSYWNSVMADCNESDLIMVGSDYVKETFVEFGFPAEKIVVVPLGIFPYFNWVKQEYPKEGRLKLVYSGGWQHWKGVDDLIDAMEILRNRGVDCSLTVLGGFSTNNTAYRKACEIKLPVDFVGHIPQECLKEYFKSADAFVFPSLRDGFAISAVEGMAAGVCLITTKESSIPIVDGDTGFLVRSHSPQEIAEKIEFLHSHREVLERVGRKGADFAAKNFTWEKYAERVEKVYEGLLSGNK